MKHRLKGFTLIELLIAVAVVAILATIAMPSYTSYVMKSKRTDAKASLMELLQAQERFRANCRQYAAGIAPVDDCQSQPVMSFPTRSTDGHYTLAVTAASATGFTATATAAVGSAQAKDKACRVMQLLLDRGNVILTPSECW